MRRKAKNIISACLIIVIVTFMGLTTYYGIKATNESNEPVMLGNMPSQNNGSMIENSQTENNQGIGTPPSMGDNEVPSMMTSANNETKTAATFYICSFGILSLLIITIILCLIVSHLNKKKMKETFYNKDKITIYALSIILLSILSTFICVAVTNNYLTSNSTNSKSEMNGPTGNNALNVTYESVKEITSDETITEGEYTSTSESENVILVIGEQETNLENITVSKTGD